MSLLMYRLEQLWDVITSKRYLVIGLLVALMFVIGLIWLIPNYSNDMEDQKEIISIMTFNFQGLNLTESNFETFISNLLDENDYDVFLLQGYHHQLTDSIGSLNIPDGYDISRLNETSNNAVVTSKLLNTLQFEFHDFSSSNSQQSTDSTNFGGFTKVSFKTEKLKAKIDIFTLDFWGNNGNYFGKEQVKELADSMNSSTADAVIFAGSLHSTPDGKWLHLSTQTVY